MRALFLLPLLALTACQSESADVDVTVPEGSTVSVDAGDASVVVVGDRVDGETTITAADLVAHADSLDGQTVLVAGTVREVCQQSGCWMTLDAPDGAVVRIAVPKDADGEYVYTFPKDVAGASVRLAGTFSVTEESVETLRHLAEDGGASPDSLARITAPKRTLALTAAGAEITRA